MVKMVITDEIHGYFKNLPNSASKAIYEKLKKRPKGYHQTSSFKLGRWDGFSCHFDKMTGSFYLYLIDKILDELQHWIDLDDMEIIDYRKNYSFSFPVIDEDFLEETGIALRDYQIETIQTGLEKQKGVFEVATSGGKTAISGGLIKATEENNLPSLTIVPSNTLVNQTYDFYSEMHLKGKVGKIDKKVKDEKSVIEECDHLVVTWQKLRNIKHYFEEFEGVVLHDEIHEFSDVAIDLWENIFYNSPFRIGMTGTLPTDDPWKKETIFCCLGEEVLMTVEDRELREEGYISDLEIEMVPVFHKEAEDEAKQYNIEGEWLYELELKYLTENEKRLKAISQFIEFLPPKNTLILGHSKFVRKLANELNLDYVAQETSYDEREVLFDRFRNENDVILPASYGTSSVGISVNEIYRLILIDPGKSNIVVSQSIGRGLRLDGVYNKVEVIDIYSNMPYSLNHKKKREGLYKKKEMTFFNSQQNIVV